MLNIGTGELLLIIIVGLLVFGPNKMPMMMRNFGKALHAFQTELTKATAVLKEGLEEPLKDLKDPQPMPGAQPVPLPEVSADVRMHEDT